MALAVGWDRWQLPSSLNSPACPSETDPTKSVLHQKLIVLLHKDNKHHTQVKRRAEQGNNVITQRSFSNLCVWPAYCGLPHQATDFCWGLGLQRVFEVTAAQRWVKLLVVTDWHSEAGIQDQSCLEKRWFLGRRLLGSGAQTTTMGMSCSMGTASCQITSKQEHLSCAQYQVVCCRCPQQHYNAEQEEHTWFIHTWHEELVIQ